MICDGLMFIRYVDLPKPRFKEYAPWVHCLTGSFLGLTRCPSTAAPSCFFTLPQLWLLLKLHFQPSRSYTVEMFFCIPLGRFCHLVGFIPSFWPWSWSPCVCLTFRVTCLWAALLDTESPFLLTRALPPRPSHLSEKCTNQKFFGSYPELCP